MTLSVIYYIVKLKKKEKKERNSPCLLELQIWQWNTWPAPPICPLLACCVPILENSYYQRLLYQIFLLTVDSHLYRKLLSSPITFSLNTKTCTTFKPRDYMFPDKQMYLSAWELWSPGFLRHLSVSWPSFWYINK